MDSHGLVAAWTRHLRSMNYSPTTIEKYGGPVNRFLTWRQLVGLGELDTTTPDDIDTWLETIGNHGPAKTSYAQALRHLFAYATRRGVFLTNPAEDCRPRTPQPEPSESYTREELVALLGTAYAHNPWWGYSIALCYYTGTRRSEVTGLRDEDIVNSEAEIHGKGGKTRKIPLSSSARRCIGALEPWSNGTVLGIKPQTFTMWVHRTATAAGFPEGRRNAHLLRATCAAHLEEAGVPASWIRDYLGHKSIDTTNRYLRRRRMAELRDAAETLSGIVVQ